MTTGSIDYLRTSLLLIEINLGLLNTAISNTEIDEEKKLKITSNIVDAFGKIAESLNDIKHPIPEDLSQPLTSIYDYLSEYFNAIRVDDSSPISTEIKGKLNKITEIYKRRLGEEAPCPVIPCKY